MGAAATACNDEDAAEQEPATHRLTLSCGAMNLERFIAALGPAEVVNGAPAEISDLAYDTRAVVPGALFFSLRGSHADGHELAPAAVDAGAAALVVDHPLDLPLPQLIVPD